MSDFDCNCDQCNNCDDPYAGEHESDCTCEECHEYGHQPRFEYADICSACAAEVDEAIKETENGNGE